MKLTGNGSRNRNVKNTGLGICKNCRCSGPEYFCVAISFRTKPQTRLQRFCLRLIWLSPYGI